MLKYFVNTDGMMKKFSCNTDGSKVYTKAKMIYDAEVEYEEIFND